MKITKFKKMSGNRYKVFLDNNDIIILNENVILDYNLLITKEINDNILLLLDSLEKNRWDNSEADIDKIELIEKITYQD